MVDGMNKGPARWQITGSTCTLSHPDPHFNRILGHAGSFSPGDPRVFTINDMGTDKVLQGHDITDGCDITCV